MIARSATEDRPVMLSAVQTQNIALDVLPAFIALQARSLLSRVPLVNTGQPKMHKVKVRVRLALQGSTLGIRNPWV